MMQFATVNGVMLHYRVDGVQDAVPLVFINSLGTDLRIWDEVIPHFADRFCIVRYDKRGHGLSDCPPAPYTIRDHADDLAGLLTALKVEAAVLVGISVGGMIAMDVAAAHPERVRALVLCDTGAIIGTAQMWKERIDTLEQHGIDSIGEAILARWFTPAFKERSTAAYRGYYQMLTRTPLAGYIGTCAAIRDADLTAAARTIQAEALVVCGTEDVATSPDLGRTLASLLPHAQFELIEKAAHLPCIERPAAFASVLERFLSSVVSHALNVDQPADRYQRGMAVRRAVLGDAHVDRAEANKTAFDADFQRFITEVAWGSVWARPHLSRKTRHLLTLAMLATLGRENELAMHIRATQNTGVTADDLKEVFQQVAVYAGIPAANAAFAVAKRVYAETETGPSHDS